MWLSFVFASSCLVSVQVSPAEGDVPAGGTLWAVSAPMGVAVEDAKGNALKFTSTQRGPALEFSVELPVGSEFFVRQLDEGDAYGEKRKPLGPWRVVDKAPTPPRPTPAIAAGKEVASRGFPNRNGWTLTSSLDAPVYEYELTTGQKTRTSWYPELWVGSGGCRPEVWSWKDGAVNVRLRAHFSDGTMSAWSNTIALAVPVAR